MTSEAGTEVKGSIIARANAYVTDSVDELRKVSKPTQREAWQFTMVTIVIICFIAVSLLILDWVFGNIMAALLS